MTRIIAELGINHDGSFSKCKKIQLNCETENITKLY